MTDTEKRAFQLLREHRNLLEMFCMIVDQRAQEKMLLTGKLEGSHYAAMKEILLIISEEQQ